LCKITISTFFRMQMYARKISIKYFLIQLLFILDIQSKQPMNRRYLYFQLFQIYTIRGHLCTKCILEGFLMLQNRTYSLQNTYPHLFANGYHAKIRIQTSAFLVKNRIPQRRLYRYFIIRMFSRECAAIQKISKRI